MSGRINAPTTPIVSPNNYVEQRNGTNQQGFRLYNTYTDDNNYERGFFRWSFGIFETGTEAAGTGQIHAYRVGVAGAGDIIFTNNFADRWRIEWQTGNLLAWNDNAWDIGAVSSGRPRKLYVATEVVAPKVTLASDPVNPLEAVTKQYVDALQARIVTLESAVATLQNQVANLIQRVNTISNNPTWSGPYAGSVVHLKNKDGDCTAAIIYEDYTKRNDIDTISVVYVDPDFPTSNWQIRRDVREDDGRPDVPFNTWHVPEYNFVATAPIQLRRLSA